MGFNGVFGSLGAAGAGVSAGLLIDRIDWRAAFIVPGTICLVTGLALLVFVIKASVADGVGGSERLEEPSREDMKRALLILLLTMFLAGIVYHTTQISLPKVFDRDMEDWRGRGYQDYGRLRRARDRTCRAAGIEQATPHDERHTCAVHAAQAGVPIVRLQKLLGHATAAMTMRYMKHAPEAYIAEDGEAIAQHMSGEGDREAAARVEAARGRDEAGVK